MRIDADTFRTIARRLLPEGPSLSPDEATALVHIAQLAGGVDLDEDADELSMVHQLSTHACALAGISPDAVPPASPLPIDAEERGAWLDRLVPRLQRPGIDELAYVIAHVVTVADLEIAPIEATFAEELRAALDLAPSRARDLAITVSSMLTPGVDAPDAGQGQPASRPID